MGGGNAQKSAAAREQNMKKLGKTDEERKAAKDAAAFVCAPYHQAFMVNVKPPALLLHVTAKHPAGTDPAACYASLAGYDPNAPAAAPAPVAAKVAPKKKSRRLGWTTCSMPLWPRKDRRRNKYNTIVDSGGELV